MHTCRFCGNKTERDYRAEKKGEVSEFPCCKDCYDKAGAIMRIRIMHQVKCVHDVIHHSDDEDYALTYAVAVTNTLRNLFGYVPEGLENFFPTRFHDQE